MFIENAKQGSNGFWLYVAGIILVIIGATIGGIPAAFVISSASLTSSATPEEISSLNFEALGVDLNLGLFVSLLQFVAGVLALWFVIVRIHDRGFKSLITPFKKVNYNKILFAAGLWFALNLGIELIMYFMNPELYQLQFEPIKFLILISICFLVLPLQTSLEELLMRGYLMQGIGMRFGYRVVPLIITSVIFGLLHILNPEIDKYGLGIMMTYYIGFGLAAAIFTLMDESLEIALGLHWANNFFGSVFVTFEGSALRTYAIFKIEEINPQLMLMGWIPMITIYGIIMAKKYKWSSWKARLIGKGVGVNLDKED